MINGVLYEIYAIMAYNFEGELRVDVITSINTLQRAGSDKDEITIRMQHGDEITPYHLRKWLGNLRFVKEELDGIKND